MHIEPGFVNHTKILLANAAGIGIIAFYAKNLIFKLDLIVRTLLAAFFFSLFMQLYHQPVGPSELHLLGAIPIYLLFGFRPTLIGFGLGLLLQGFLFDPTDMPHLAINSLSLIMPLLLLHYTIGKNINANKLTSTTYKQLIKMDAVFYSGVAAMVGFWLIGETASSLSSWAAFAVSYLPFILLESGISMSILVLLKKYKQNRVIQFCCDAHC